MKKRLKIMLIILAVLIIVAIIAYTIYYLNMPTEKAVVVKVDDYSLVVETIEDKELLSVGFTKKGNIGFKKGQEVEIRCGYNAMILAIFPGHLTDVKDIKITKQKSDVPISKHALQFCYSSIDKVKCFIDELTDSGITFTIIDINETPYDYNSDYSMSKKTENPNGYYIAGTERKNEESPRWEDMKKIANIPNENIEEILLKKEEANVFLEKRRIDWTSLYGKLEERRILFLFYQHLCWDNINRI